MNEMLSKILSWKRKPYDHISCIPYEWDLNETWNLCVSYVYYMNEMPRKVWLWKEIILCAHHINEVSCIVWMECYVVMFMRKKVSVLSLRCLLMCLSAR